MLATNLRGYEGWVKDCQIHLPADCLAPLGVGGRIPRPDESVRLWGIFLDSSFTDTTSTAESAATHRDFIISTIHPSLWPSSARLNMLLRDRPGAIHEALDVLSSCELDIQSVNAAFVGHRSGCLQVIANSRTLTRKWAALENALQAKAASLHGDNADVSLLLPQLRQARIFAFQQVGLLQLVGMIKTVSRIIDEDATARKAGRGFLDDASLERGSLPWYIDHSRWNDLDAFIQHATGLGVLDRLQRTGNADRIGVSGEPLTIDDALYSTDPKSARGLIHDLVYLANAVRNIKLSDHWQHDLRMSEPVAAQECNRIIEDADHFGLQKQGELFWGLHFLRGIVVDHCTLAVYPRALLRLAYFALNRDFSIPPIPLQCVRQGDELVLGLDTETKSTLQIGAASSASNARSIIPLAIDGGCMVSVSGPDHYARVRFLSREDATDRSGVLQFTYTIKRDPKNSEATASRLVARVASAIAQCGIDIERISTRLVKSAPELEIAAAEIMLHLPASSANADSQGWRQLTKQSVANTLGAYVAEFNKSNQLRGTTIQIEVSEIVPLRV